MASRKLIDSHIHLWPASAANTDSHAWMSAAPQMAKQHSVEEYCAAASNCVSFSGGTGTGSSDLARPHHLGAVYIETDRVLTASFPYNEAEIRWVDRLCSSPSGLIQGVVLWAPMDKGPDVFRRYLSFIEERFPLVRERLVGFRYLLQNITERDEFLRLVDGDAFLGSLEAFNVGARRFTFDVGVTQKFGLWQLEAVAEMIERLNSRREGTQKVTFILNHFGKPTEFGMSRRGQPNDSASGTWEHIMKRLASNENVYIKLSGLFSMLPKRHRGDVEEFYGQIEEKLEVVLRLFGPRRCMFGSDWPVCNIFGPSDESTWAEWFELVNLSLKSHNLSEKDSEWVWWRTATEAYNLGLG